MARGEFGIRRGMARTGDYTFCWRGQSSGINSEWIKIDPTRNYELSGWFKTQGGTPVNMTFGLVMADAQERQIRHWNLFSVPGTRTELARPCRTGDRMLYLRDASGWKTGGVFAAAFGAEENKLTFQTAPLGIESVRQMDSQWVVALSSPCGLALSKGTAVVENRSGNHGIFVGAGWKTTGEWAEIKGVITPKQWWPGAAFARVVILPRRAADMTVLFDDLALREISETANGFFAAGR